MHTVCNGTSHSQGLNFGSCSDRSCSEDTESNTETLAQTAGSMRSETYKGRFLYNMPCPCRAHAVPLPCRAAKGLECVFPFWFTQCDRVWFTLAMPCPCHVPTTPFFSRPRHDRRETAVSCCGLEKNGMVGAWHGKCESDTAALCKSNGKDTF
jgi:hypothetical protein